MCGVICYAAVHNQVLSIFGLVKIWERLYVFEGSQDLMNHASLAHPMKGPFLYRGLSEKRDTTRSPAQVGCMRQVLGAGALGRPRGMGMGNTCKSMADSCQCMAKTATIL